MLRSSVRGTKVAGREALLMVLGAWYLPYGAARKWHQSGTSFVRSGIRGCWKVPRCCPCKGLRGAREGARPLGFQPGKLNTPIWPRGCQERPTPVNTGSWGSVEQAPGQGRGPAYHGSGDLG